MVSTIGAVVDCEADSAVVSWQPSTGAVSYITELTAASGHVACCATNHTNCELSSVQCGAEYNVTVKAVGGSCNSTAQMAGYLATGTLCSPECLTVVRSDVINLLIYLLSPIRALCSGESLCQLQCKHCQGDVGRSQRCQLLLCACRDQSGLDIYLQYKSH